MRVGSVGSSGGALAAALLALAPLATPPVALNGVAYAATERVGADGRIELAEPPTVDVTRPGAVAVTSRCFLDVSIGGEAPPRRIVVELFGEQCPRAAENFRQLCTGEPGYGYAGSSFYRIVSGLTLQAGEIRGGAAGDSAPGRAALGATFEHDNMAIKHNVAGLVSMSNSALGGGGTQSDSRFLIQLPDDAAFLDGRYEAFGRVSEGMDVISAIARVPVSGTKNMPTVPVRIVASGELQSPDTPR